MVQGMASKIAERIKYIKQEQLFVVFALILGIAMAIVNPPLQEPDGPAHMWRVIDVANGNVLSPIVTFTHEPGLAVVPENVNVLNFRIVEPDKGEGVKYIEELNKVSFSKDTVKAQSNQAVMSFLYYPQAIGYNIAMLFGLSVYKCIVFARIFNLLVYIVLVYYAIRKIPVLKNSLLVLALFPMSIYQAASVSPDAMLNGMCFLFVGMCLYYVYGTIEQLGLKHVIWLGILLAFIFMAKYVYVLLGLLVFLIPKEKFKNKKYYYICFGVSILPILLSAGISLRSAGSVVTSGQAVASGGMTQLQYMQQHPTHIFKVLLNTGINKFTDYMLWLNVLGWLNYSLGPLIYIVPMFAMYVLASDVSELNNKITRKHRILSLIAFLLICVGIVVGIYIGDGRINEVGSNVVEGVQGRYFIPILPALYLTLVPGKIKNEDACYPVKVGCVAGVLLLLAVLIMVVHCF